MYSVIYLLLQGYVELLIHPLKPDLKRLKINSKQCHIFFMYLIFLALLHCLVDLQHCAFRAIKVAVAFLIIRIYCAITYQTKQSIQQAM